MIPYNAYAVCEKVSKRTAEGGRDRQAGETK